MARVVKYDGDIPCLELIDTTGQTVRNYERVCDMCIYRAYTLTFRGFFAFFHNIPWTPCNLAWYA